MLMLKEENPSFANWLPKVKANISSTWPSLEFV